MFIVKKYITILFNITCNPGNSEKLSSRIPETVKAYICICVDENITFLGKLDQYHKIM